MNYDVEKYFGSLGNFFKYEDYDGHFYTANPPFQGDIVISMFNRLIEQHKKKKFSVLIFMPLWDKKLMEYAINKGILTNIKRFELIYDFGLLNLIN